MSESAEGKRGETIDESTSNKRKFTRIHVALEAITAADDKIVIRGHSTDLSLGGTFIYCSETLPVGTPCHLILLLGGPDVKLGMPVQGKVVRVEDKGMAIEFGEIGQEGQKHLEKLLYYNSPCPEAILGEFKPETDPE